MKIVLLIDSLTCGGAQRQMIYLANGLSKLGQTVFLVVYHDHLQLLNELDRCNVQLLKVLKKRKGLDPRFVFRLGATLQNCQPDVIVSFLTGPNLWARLCGPLSGAKAIITSVRNTDIDRSRVESLLERLMHRRSSAIVANTEAAKRQLVHHRIPDAKISVIPNGVDTAKFCRLPIGDRLRIRQRYDLKTEDFAIILPGKIEEQKNHLCLIEALARIGTCCDRFQVMFFGSENDLALKSRLIRRIEDLQLNHCIRLCGSFDRMVEIYNMADVVVLPSDWEGSPNVVLEAMACETPVIVSDVADNRQLVHPECGLLFERNNREQLADHLMDLAGKISGN